MILSLIMVWVTFLFIIVLINSAIEEAPERLFSINQTLIILIGASVTYKLYKSQAGPSFFEVLAKANEKRICRAKSDPKSIRDMVDIKENWKTANHEELMASLFIEKLLEHSGRD